MKHVFIRIEESSSKEGEEVVTCELLNGERAESFLDNPKKFLRHYDDAKLLSQWVVPKELENACSDGMLNEVFDTLLALEALAETPVVSDLFATIFNAGYLCRSAETSCH